MLLQDIQEAPKAPHRHHHQPNRQPEASLNPHHNTPLLVADMVVEVELLLTSFPHDGRESTVGEHPLMMIILCLPLMPNEVVSHKYIVFLMYGGTLYHKNMFLLIFSVCFVDFYWFRKSPP